MKTFEIRSTRALLAAAALLGAVATAFAGDGGGVTDGGSLKTPQRPLPDGTLKIVATGEKEDPALAA